MELALTLTYAIAFTIIGGVCAAMAWAADRDIKGRK